MAKIKVRREGNLLWEDKCQPLTTEQMNDIKSQFHPSNTANVNIVPYHIYDEDGVEQRVGEVRKTIDGVKKSKPVYEKTIISNAPAVGSHEWFITPIPNVETWFTLTASAYENDNLTGVTVSNTNASNGQVYDFSITSYMPTTGRMWVIRGASTACTKVRIIVRYTLTTDEWQPV